MMAAMGESATVEAATEKLSEWNKLMAKDKQRALQVAQMMAAAAPDNQVLRMLLDLYG